MNRPGIVIIITMTLSLVLLGCGGEPSVTEGLKVVPGLCFLHVHVSREMDPGLLPAEAGLFMPMWLVDSLHARGGLGVSLLGVNLTDLSPQLMFLSHNVGVEEMTGIGMAGFGCSAQENGGRFDLVDHRGSVLGSVARRDGWTCLVTGSGADRSAGRWLEMEEWESLAADTDLVAISGSRADLTVLVSRNSISFLSVIPTGMLDRRQIAYLNLARGIIADIGIRAAMFSIDITDNDPAALVLEAAVVREGGEIMSLSLGFSDTGIAPDSLGRWGRRVLF